MARLEVASVTCLITFWVAGACSACGEFEGRMHVVDNHPTLGLVQLCGACCSVCSKVREETERQHKLALTAASLDWEEQVKDLKGDQIKLF